MDIRKYSFTIVVIVIFTLLYLVFLQSKKVGNINNNISDNSSSKTSTIQISSSDISAVSKKYNLEIIKQVEIENFDN